MCNNVACGICKFEHGYKTNSLFRPNVFYTKIGVLQKATLQCQKTLKSIPKEFIFVYKVACIKTVTFKKK